MKISTANFQWDRSKSESIPGIPHCAIAVLQKSGIGEAYLNIESHDQGIYILHQEDLPSLQEVLDGEPWFGTKDLMPLVQFFADYLAKNKDQRSFCFVTVEG